VKGVVQKGSASRRNSAQISYRYVLAFVNLHLEDKGLISVNTAEVLREAHLCNDAPMGTTLQGPAQACLPVG